VKLFSRRIAELEIKNRLLTDAAQKRARRVEELERELEQKSGPTTRIAQLEERLRRLEAELRRLEAERAFYSKRTGELEEHNRQLSEAATKYASRILELESEFTRIAALLDQAPST
jgi:chromosome segregation ATPase